MADSRTPQRGKIADRNQQRAAFDERPREQAEVDTFAKIHAERETLHEGLIATVAKFGMQVGAKELEKQVKSDFIQGQALQATGQALTGSETPPTRQGHKAMDARLQVQAWASRQKEHIDNLGGNKLSYVEYNQSIGAAMKDLMGDDPELNNMITAAASAAVPDLASYHAKAYLKRSNADAMTAVSSSINGYREQFLTAQSKGDVEGAQVASDAMIESYAAPLISNPELRKQTQIDNAVTGLTSGDATGLMFIKESGIDLTADEQRTLNQAETAYNKLKRAEYNKTFHDDSVALDQTLAGLGTNQEIKDNIEAHRTKYPNRYTPNQLIALETAAVNARGKRMVHQSLTRSYSEGKVASQSGATTKQRMEAKRAFESNVDATVPDIQQAREVKGKAWSTNQVIDSDLKLRLNSGLSTLITGDGKLGQNVQATFEEAAARYSIDPDLTLKHLSEKERITFLNLRTLMGDGQMPSLFAAASQLELNKSSIEMTRDVRQQHRDAVDDVVDGVMGNGFMSYVPEFLGGTAEIKNREHVRQRVTALATSYMATGLSDPEAAAEAARIKVMESSDQLDGSVISVGKRPLHDRMGVDPARAQEAWEHGKKFFIDELNPDLAGKDSIILGDPKNNSVLYSTVNEFGAIENTVSVDLSIVGKYFSGTVIGPENKALAEEERANVLVSKDRRTFIDRAVETGAYTEETAAIAYDNEGTSEWYNAHQLVGDNVRTEEMIAAEVDTPEELRQLKMADDIFSRGREPTAAEAKGIQTGDFESVVASRTLAGSDAVAEVTRQEGELTPTEEFIVQLEGFAPASFRDSNRGVVTQGVGQTGEFIGKSFKSTVKTITKRAEKAIPKLNDLDENLQRNIVAAFYRGSLTGSPKTLKLINEGKYQEAATEFLDNDEFRAAVKSGSGVAARMQLLAAALRNQT